MHLTIGLPAVLAMAAAGGLLLDKPVGVEDGDEVPERALQAGHATGNPIGGSFGRLPGRATVARNSRAAQASRTRNGARRRSSRERTGSGSFMAVST